MIILPESNLHYLVAYYLDVKLDFIHFGRVFKGIPFPILTPNIKKFNFNQHIYIIILTIILICPHHLNDQYN
jgi:hypothetical protein